MARTPVPNPKAIRDLLLDLVGREVVVTPSQPMLIDPGDPVTVAVYVTDAQRLAAAAAVDLPLSAYLGAALGLVPVGGAEAAIEDGELPPNLAENLHEVVNIMAALFNVGEAPHLKLDSMFPPGQRPPNDVAAVLGTFGSREDLTVDVRGYGKGQLSVVVAS